MTDPTDYRAGSGRGSRRSGAARPDPADLRQLADSPVSLRRIA
jgi:ATP-binding cassette subfamily B protein